MNFQKIYIDDTQCKTLIDALENYRREWDEQRKVHKNTPLHNWACFTKETLLLTRNGMRQIINIRKDDEILTLYGWKKCNQAQLMKKNAQLVEVSFRDGTKVRCTPDHKFLTINGWKSAKNLTKDIEIQSSLMKLPNISMDIYTDYGQIKGILPKVELHYIEMFGQMLLEKYHQIATYITSILIHNTISYGTSYAYPYLSIGKYQDQIIRDSVLNVEKQPLIGMHQMREYCFIKDLQCEQKIGKNGKENYDHAYIAQKNLNVLSEEMAKNRNFVIPTAKQLLIESVESLNVVDDVYCINVPDIHHFSLSNGAIVHNSNYADSFRYMIQSLPLCNVNTTTAKDLENRFKQAKIGTGSEPDFRTHRY
jgi:intein/homing endonuclease